MYKSVKNAFLRFTGILEGITPWMYLDENGQVTTGYGNLVDNEDDVLRPLIVWERKDGSLATRTEIIEEWHAVKALQDKRNAPVHYWFERARLLQRADDMERYALAQLDGYERVLKSHPAFAQYEFWPADAQLACLSMIWAMGYQTYTSKFPKFLNAASKNDFVTMSLECEMDATHNPGLIRRNQENKKLLMNADIVSRHGLMPEALYWPGVASIAPAAKPTKPTKPAVPISILPGPTVS